MIFALKVTYQVGYCLLINDDLCLLINDDVCCFESRFSDHIRSGSLVSMAKLAFFYTFCTPNGNLRLISTKLGIMNDF